MFNNAKNSKQQGDIGLGSAIAYFTHMGWVVSLPLTESQNYDLIVDDGQKVYKVQVKTSSHIKDAGNYEVLLKTCGGNQSFHTVKHFKPESLDLLFILTSNGDTYCVPTKDITNRSTITLGNKYKKYKVGIPHGSL